MVPVRGEENRRRLLTVLTRNGQTAITTSVAHMGYFSAIARAEKRAGRHPPPQSTVLQPPPLDHPARVGAQTGCSCSCFGGRELGKEYAVSGQGEAFCTPSIRLTEICGNCTLWSLRRHDAEITSSDATDNISSQDDRNPDEYVI